METNEEKFLKKYYPTVRMNDKWDKTLPIISWDDCLEIMNTYAQQKPVVSDEDIQDYINEQPYYGTCITELKEGIEQGAKWMRDKLTPKEPTPTEKEQQPSGENETTN